MRVFDKWHIAIVSLALLALVVFNVNSGSNSETTDRPNPHTASSQPSAPSAPQTNDNQSKQSVSDGGKTQGDYIAVGQYMCSRYHHNTVQNLNPDETEKQAIKENGASLKAEIDDINSLNAEIDNYEVDRSSQSSVNHYNNLVNDYNSLLKTHRINAANHTKRINNYNANVERYNNYLMENCRKK